MRVGYLLYGTIYTRLPVTRKCRSRQNCCLWMELRTFRLLPCPAGNSHVSPPPPCAVNRADVDFRSVVQSGRETDGARGRS